MNRILQNLVIGAVCALFVVINLGPPPAPFPINYLHSKLQSVISPLGLNSAGRYFSKGRIDFVLGIYGIDTGSGKSVYYALNDGAQYWFDLEYLRASSMLSNLGRAKEEAEELAVAYAKDRCQAHPEAKRVSIARVTRHPLTPFEASQGMGVDDLKLLRDQELLLEWECQRTLGAGYGNDEGTRNG